MARVQSGDVISLPAAREAIRLQFLGWQCRLRQLSVREDEGRPSPGMRPSLHGQRDSPAATRLTTVLVPLEPETITAELCHQVRRTHDPKLRREAALKYLSAHHYQYPADFSDALTALFGPGPGPADQLLEARQVWLHFDQFNQRFWLPCAPRELPEDHPDHQLTYWHNALFNPHIPGGARVLAFQPDWALAEADPAVRPAG